MKLESILEVDEHHDVILSETISTAVSGKRGGVLVNFDSHDDMGIQVGRSVAIGSGPKRRV